MASLPSPATDPARLYVAARAAAMNGNHGEAAQLLAEISGSSKDVAQQAVSEAISAGNFNLALQLISRSPQAANSFESRLLLVADALRRGQSGLAEQWLGRPGGDIDLSVWDGLVTAWTAADRGDRNGAIAALSAIPRTSAFAPFVDEETALVLLRFGQTAQAEQFARRAIGKAGTREYRVRLALAAGFEAAGDRDRALAMIDGIDADQAAVKSKLESGRLKSARIDTAAKAFSEQLLAIVMEMRRAQNVAGDPFNIVQIARFAAPENSAATVMAGVLLDEEGNTGQALVDLRSIPAGDPFEGEALNAEARALIGTKRFDEALALVQAKARASTATADDYARLGDVLSSMKRFDEAADAYREAVAHSAGAEPGRIWPLLLQRADALESAHRWPEAKQAVEQALKLAPNEPQVLNFVGYVDLQHGEDFKAAEALIRKASALDPDDAGITDSLGWALYKQGRIDDAIDTLQKAAAGDPAQSEIQEHLGDALYTAGYRFRARYAWRAALATADSDAEARLTAKIAIGLSQATAAR